MEVGSWERRGSVEETGGQEAGRLTFIQCAERDFKHGINHLCLADGRRKSVLTLQLKSALSKLCQRERERERERGSEKYVLVCVREREDECDRDVTESQMSSQG